MRKIFFVILLAAGLSVQGTDMYGVYPTHWWIGMKNPKVQLLLHGENIGLFNKATISYAGIKVQKVTRLESNNYLVIDLLISPSAKPGTFKIVVSGGAPGAEDIKLLYLK